MSWIVDIIIIIAVIFLAIFLDTLRKINVNLPQPTMNIDLHNLSKNFDSDTKFIIGYKLGKDSIDLLAIGHVGIIVIKALNFQGTVKGNEMGDTWSSFIEDYELRFENPIVFNDKVIAALKEKLGYDYNYYSLVHFFNEAKLEINYSEGQDLFISLPSTITSIVNELEAKTKILTNEEITKIYQSLMAERESNQS